MTDRPSRLRKFAYLGSIAVFLFTVFFSQRHLNHQREVLGLTRNIPLENAPPILAFTTKALGGFRGLIANALWIRATELQENGKYFEMVQLADWITKLEPKLTAVWVHLAWNMAYNISVKFNDPADRWLWVKRGTELLRDEALKYNPREPNIYRELAWFYQHKMGHYLDDAHQLYKVEWAKEMTALLGKGDFNFDRLISPQTPEEIERARKLREQYKLDPAFMKRVDERYGPLEWRLPESHAIYWATYGLEMTKDQKLRQEEFIGLRRVIFQSLQLAFMRGRLVYPDKSGNEFVYGPNLHVIDEADKAYLEMANLEADKRDNILNAHKNYLGMVVYHLYTHNRRQAAQQWFNRLKEMYPGANTIAGKPVENLEDYALSRIAEDVGETDPNRVKTIIMGTLENAFLQFALGDSEADIVAENHVNFARRLWQRYMTEISRYEKNIVRVGLPPFNQLYEETLKGVLSPEYGLDAILSAQLRTRLNLPADYGVSTNEPPAEATAPSATTPAGPATR
ncbi:MAG TPA: hypothetical protein VF773_04920 [Verrucomicrobiae bacterium]